MGRIPKYRAWDKKRNEMVEVSVLDFNSYEGFPHGYIIVVDGYEWNKDPETGEAECQISMDDCILLEYTGFTDAGHEDLYERDIFEDDAEWYRIEWWQDYGQWQCVPIRHNPLERDNIALSEFGGSYTCWKQGNIYENPELLEKQKQ